MSKQIHIHVHKTKDIAFERSSKETPEQRDLAGKIKTQETEID